MQTDNWYFRADWLEEQKALVRERLAERAAAAPLDPGVPLAELYPAKPWATAIVELLGVERRGPSVYLPGAAPTIGGRTDEAARLESVLAKAGPAGARVDDRELARYLEGEGLLVRLGQSHAVSPQAYAEASATAVAECERAGAIELARFRDLLGISRRPAQLLLERLDADGVTRRVGDARVLRRAARERA